MARPKKPKYEYVEKLGRYRKRIKDADGKYVAIYGSTPKELEAKVAQAQEMIRQAEFRRENPTVREYAEKWLEMHSANVRATTMKDYRSTVKVHIIRPLGDKLMSEVTADDVKMAIVDASRKSTSLYRKTQMLYKMIFTSAVDSHIIRESPCDKLNPKGGTPAKEKEALSPVQIETLKNAVKGLPVESFVMLALYAGLRREEILGLRWKNVHLDSPSPYLAIKSTWYTLHNRPVVVDDLKTGAGKRNIPIPKILFDFLKNKRSHSMSDYVIANAENKPLSETQWQNMWNGVVNRTVKERTYTRYKNGDKMIRTIKPTLGEASRNNPSCICTMDFIPTPHQLRHTYISNLLLEGVDIKTTQYLAGHKHAKITLDIYAHLIYNRPEDLSEKVAKAFEGSDNSHNSCIE